MKRKMFAGITLAATLALTTAVMPNVVSVQAETYSTNDLFVLSNATGESVSCDGVDYLGATLADGGMMQYKQNLALEWRVEEGARYFSTDLVFSGEYEQIDFTMESNENSVTKDGKATNVLSFTKSEVFVNDGSRLPFEGNEAVITLARAESSGVFTVFVNGIDVGDFTNVGGNYAPYRALNATVPCVPITISATGGDTTIGVKELNGQSFALTDGKVTDDTPPVFVVSDEVRSFILGYTISLNYITIDVCDESVTKSVRYSQYGVDGDSALTSSSVIFETDSYAANGAEYINILATLSDDSDNEMTYDLAWYARESDLTEIEGIKYFSVTRNSVSPSYVGTQEQYEAYQQAVTKAAEGVTVGENSYVYLPSLKDLIVDDDTAYEGCTFTIYYKKQNASSVATSSGLSYDKLSLKVDAAGKYAIKIVASDKMGNPMLVKVNGKDVPVSTSNVFDAEEIPVFTFTIYNHGVSVENGESQKSGYVGATYSVSSFKINAVAGYEDSYRLFYVDTDRYHADNGSYPSYEQLVADPTAYRDYFVEIEEYNSSITEDDDAWALSDNDYAWKPNSLTFVPQKTGYYVVEAEVTDAELYGMKDYGYMAIEITAKQDVVVGESTWINDNIVSLIILAVSGVFVLGIICVLVIDPKEKDLDDLDEPQTSKKGKKAKKD